MSLPKIETAHLTKTVLLPISGKKVKIRPFLAKEEKLMLMMKESQSTEEITEIICDIMNVITFNTIDARKLPAPDIEVLFLAARCLSKGETSELTYICRAKVPDPNSKDGKGLKTCSTPVPIVVQLDDVKLVTPPEHSKTVQIDGTPFAINFRYPTVADSQKMGAIDSDADLFKLISSLIESVSNTETGVVYEDFTQEDLLEFLDDLPFGFLGEVANKFLGSMPSLTKNIKFKCPSCGHEEDIEIKGLTNFF